MCAAIHPTLILHMNFDSRMYSEQLKTIIKRTYAYVAPSVISSHESDSADAENIMRFSIKVHKAYWDKNNEQAQEIWKHALPVWLHNMFSKVSRTITAVNTQRFRRFQSPIDYSWIELEFDDNAHVSIATRKDCSIASDSYEMVDELRDLMGDAVFGSEHIACVHIPSRASYETQKQAAIEAEREKQKKDQAQQEIVGTETDEAQASSKANSVSDAEAKKNVDETRAAPEFVSSQDRLQDASESEKPDDGSDQQDGAAFDSQSFNDDSIQETQTAQKEKEAEEAEEAEEEKEAFPVSVTFDPDYTVWGIEYDSGLIREFDSKAKIFIK